MLVNTTGVNRRALKKAVPPFLLLFTSSTPRQTGLSGCIDTPHRGTKPPYMKYFGKQKCLSKGYDIRLSWSFNMNSTANILQYFKYQSFILLFYYRMAMTKHVTHPVFPFFHHRMKAS